MYNRTQVRIAQAYDLARLSRFRAVDAGLRRGLRVVPAGPPPVGYAHWNTGALGARGVQAARGAQENEDCGAPAYRAHLLAPTRWTLLDPIQIRAAYELVALSDDSSSTTSRPRSVTVPNRARTPGKGEDPMPGSPVCEGSLDLLKGPGVPLGGQRRSGLALDGTHAVGGGAGRRHPGGAWRRSGLTGLRPWPRRPNPAGHRLGPHTRSSAARIVMPVTSVRPTLRVRQATSAARTPARRLG